MSSAAPFVPQKPPLPRPRYGNLLPARGLQLEQQLAALKAKRPALFTVKPRGGGGGRPWLFLSSRTGPHAPPALKSFQPPEAGAGAFAPTTAPEEQQNAAPSTPPPDQSSPPDYDVPDSNAVIDA